ncbi:enoyl-CoA hydratase/isomerase family protein [Oceanobacillus salinisoli]|uniref:enoyl-CoA hydratase/isomerase family protein n=1 Tax=Oceanobacillus salinisoli TaxID=2678611 RepID=UPI0012E14EC5|nr:enoyl-CoA hydratase/isomerase family protein [Oceanobacillus salinisoli]
MGNYQFIHVEMLENGIAKVQINRPDALNALNSEVITELDDVVTKFEDDQNVACVILTGNERSFVAGADIHELKEQSVSGAYEIAMHTKKLHDNIIHSKKPYIAVIQGYCLGGGLELALACDISLADEKAKFGLPEINLGIIPGGGGIQRILELAGTSFATQMIMTGDPISAEKAEKLNVINEISTNPLEEAISIARKISSKSPYAISSLKTLINKRRLRQSEMELKEEIYEFSQLFDHPDAFEGISAFIEKRKPVFHRGDNK